MATEDKLYKMNVRSPFYIVATTEGAPTSIVADFNQEEDTDDTDVPDDDGLYTDDNLPDQPDEYVAPPTDSRDTTTGDTIRVSSDIGIRTYNITDSVGKTGDFTIDYTANVPIRIEVSSDGDTTNTYNNKYYGNNFYEDAMTDAGVSASDLDQLTDDASASGTLTFTKNNGSGMMKVTVYTNLETDDYTLTFNAPAVVPQDSPEGGPIPASYRTLPASPGDDAYDVSSRYKIEFNVFGIWFAEDWNANNASKNSTIDVIVNGTVVKSNLPYNECVIISDATTVTAPRWTTQPRLSSTRLLQPMTTHYVSRGTHLKVGYNDIRIRTNADFYGKFQIARMGVFHSGGQWRYTEPSDQRYRRPIELGSQGQNSYINYEQFTGGLRTSDKNAGYTHRHLKIDWYEPGDGTHAYVRNNTSEQPWYIQNVPDLEEHNRSAMFNEYKVTASGSEQLIPTITGQEYFIRLALGGEGYSGPGASRQKPSNQADYF